VPWCSCGALYVHFSGWVELIFDMFVAGSSKIASVVFTNAGTGEFYQNVTHSIVI
jgi:hypothetical protein